MTIRSLVVVVALVSGCRFGVLAGSTHGHGKTSVGTASFSTNDYELTLDVVFHRVVLLSGLGLSDVGARMRVDGDPTIDHQGNGLDSIASVGAGFDLLQTRGFHLTAYGMYTRSFGGLDSSTLGSRYTAGIELGGRFLWLADVVVRAGMSTANATYHSNLIDQTTFEVITYDASPTVFMLEVGLGIDGTDFAPGGD